MFGTITEPSQNESTAFNPQNPYSAAKLYAHHLAGIYRKNYNLFISCGILFNHESPRRGMHFITQKVAYAAACINQDIQNSPLLNERGEPIVKNGKLSLGNLDAKRDWGHAEDFVEAMWLMLQQDTPEDYVIGTGQLHSIRELCEIAFSHAGLSWDDYVVTDTNLLRPTETGFARADITKAKMNLNWEPRKNFSETIAELVKYHLETMAVFN